MNCRAGIHPVYISHNALYHVFQMVALFLFFLGGRWLICKEVANTSGDGHVDAP